jgi:hypothetical protein
MRKIAPALALLFALGLASAPGLRAAIGLRAGVWFGPQQVNDPRIDAAYGAGETFVAFPCLELRFGSGWTLAAGYELGYSRSTVMGPYDYPATLKMSGAALLAGYEFRTGRVALFAQGGVGRYAYAQTVANPNVTDMPVDAHQTAALAAGGIKVYPTDAVFIGFEARYVSLKVKPYDATVDLGGWRFAFGAGFALDFR